MALPALRGRQALSSIGQRYRSSVLGISSLRTFSVNACYKRPCHFRYLHKTLAAYNCRSFVSNVGKLGPESSNTSAYLSGCAIKGVDELVDVKKVLVIGSGGISIGQAGEFDYSGTSMRSSIESVGNFYRRRESF